MLIRAAIRASMAGNSAAFNIQPWKCSFMAAELEINTSISDSSKIVFHYTLEYLNWVL